MKLNDLNPINSTGVYVAAQLTQKSKDRIQELISKLGVPNAISADKLHTTIMYSYDPCTPELYNEYDLGSVVFKNHREAKVKELKVFHDDKGCDSLVLSLESEYLTNRHDYLKSVHELKYTYPDYKPHITLSYDVGDYEYDDIKVTDYIKRVKFSEEYIEELKE